MYTINDGPFSYLIILKNSCRYITRPRGTLGSLERKLGVPVRISTTLRVVYLVDVSESSGAGSPGCRGQINGCQAVVAVVVITH